MKEQNKLVSFGDLSINLNAVSTAENIFPVTYQSDLAGSSALVAAVAGALGERINCVGKVGDDDLGTQVIEVLSSFNVGCEMIERVPNKRTALTINRNRSTSDSRHMQTVSYRKDSAAGTLKPDDIHPGYFEKGDILFYSSDVMIENSSRSALEKALKLANQSGTTIMYAPLIHSENWINDKIARETIMHTLPHTHFLIVTEKELQFLTEISEEHASIKKLFAGKMKGLIILKPSNRLTYATTMDKGRLVIEGDEPLDAAASQEVFVGTFISQWLSNGCSIENVQAILADPDKLEAFFTESLKKACRAGQIEGTLAAIEDLRK